MKTLQQLLSMKVKSQDWQGQSVDVSPDFRIAIQKVTDGYVRIIVHPFDVSGDTLDYKVIGDQLHPV